MIRLQVIQVTPCNSSSIIDQRAFYQGWLWVEEIAAFLGDSVCYIREPQNTSTALTQLLRPPGTEREQRTLGDQPCSVQICVKHGDLWKLKNSVPKQGCTISPSRNSSPETSVCYLTGGLLWLKWSHPFHGTLPSSRLGQGTSHLLLTEETLSEALGFVALLPSDSCPEMDIYKKGTLSTAFLLLNKNKKALISLPSLKVSTVSSTLN